MSFPQLSRRHLLAGIAGTASSMIMSPAQAQSFTSSAGSLALSPVASGLEHPWGFAFLPEAG